VETAVLVTAVVIAAILAILLTYYSARFKFEKKFRAWQEIEIQRLEEERARTRKEAINQSRAVLGGRFTEQMAPYLPDFKYDPTEARFIGSPIDMVVFPGLATGEPKEIVIMEIKSGKNCQLTPSERKIRQLIEDGMVRWELLKRMPENGDGEAD